MIENSKEHMYTYVYVSFLFVPHKNIFISNICLSVDKTPPFIRAFCWQTDGNIMYLTLLLKSYFLHPIITPEINVFQKSIVPISSNSRSFKRDLECFKMVWNEMNQYVNPARREISTFLTPSPRNPPTVANLSFSQLPFPFQVPFLPSFCPSRYNPDCRVLSDYVF